MKRRHYCTKGFSLIEVVMALGITVFALITILALLPVGLGANRVSIQQTEATNLATGIVADLRQTPTAAAIAASGTLTSLSPRYGIDVTKASTTFYLDPSGNSSTAVTAASRYKVTIALTQPTPPPAGQRNATATYGSIVVGWPAANPLNSISAFIALDRN